MTYEMAFSVFSRYSSQDQKGLLDTNRSFTLWLVKHYLNNSSYYLNIIFSLNLFSY